MAATQNTEDKTYLAKQGNKYHIFLVTEEVFFLTKATFNKKKKKKRNFQVYSAGGIPFYGWYLFDVGD